MADDSGGGENMSGCALPCPFFVITANSCHSNRSLCISPLAQVPVVTKHLTISPFARTLIARLRKLGGFHGRFITSSNRQRVQEGLKDLFWGHAEMSLREEPCDGEHFRAGGA